jgi:hypothetical protein
MNATETVIIDKKALGRKGSPIVSEKVLRQLPKDIEGGHLVVIIADLLESLKTEPIFTIAKYPESARRFEVKLFEAGTPTSRREFLKEVEGFLSMGNVSWIDTNVKSFDWTELHSMSVNAVIAKLTVLHFNKAYVSLQREDGRNDYLTYRIID